MVKSTASELKMNPNVNSSVLIQLTIDVLTLDSVSTTITCVMDTTTVRMEKKRETAADLGSAREAFLSLIIQVPDDLSSQSTRYQKSSLGNTISCNIKVRIAAGDLSVMSS